VPLSLQLWHSLGFLKFWFHRRTQVDLIISTFNKLHHCSYFLTIPTKMYTLTFLFRNQAIIKISVQKANWSSHPLVLQCIIFQLVLASWQLVFQLHFLSKQQCFNLSQALIQNTINKQKQITVSKRWFLWWCDHDEVTVTVQLVHLMNVAPCDCQSSDQANDLDWVRIYTCHCHLLLLSQKADTHLPPYAREKSESNHALQ